MDPLEFGLRRTSPPVPLPTDGQPRLVERIRDEIATRGPMTFARFMELALYDPADGYYRSAVERPGRTGDFLTAPETHPIFGAAIARQLDEVWHRMGEPASFLLREHGAGSGALGLAILRALAGQGPGGSAAASPGLAGAIRYGPIEINEYRRTDLVERLVGAGFGSALALDLPPDVAAVGAVIANEFLDALPVHRLERRDGELRELFVGWDGGGFAGVLGPLSTPTLGDRLAAEGVELAEGARAEVCPGIDDWVREVGAGLDRGCVLVIDYGYPAAELYGAGRAGGTLRAYAGHRVHDDPFVAVGRQDLTAHVDFTAVERAAAAAGLTTLGRTTQAEFLAGAGADEVLDAIRSDPSTTIEEWLLVRAALGRMLNPRAMGGFLVLVLGRGLAAEPPLRGLRYRLSR
jgi:SAM-dependent MidA family methyltransferase